jgi:hypothetical protein
VQASVGAFVALGTAMAAGLILAAGALVSLPPLLVACAALAVVMAVVGMTAEAWRVSGRTGRNWWRSLGLSLKAGARFLFQLL